VVEASHRLQLFKKGRLDVPPKDFWLLAGNSQTDPANDYLGTSDGQPLVIRTAGTEHLRIDPAGNVGIATPSPAYPLHLAAGKALRIEGGTSASDTAAYFSFGGNGAFSIDAPGIPSGRLVVDNSGNVGIGNPSPGYPLHLAPGKALRIEGGTSQTDDASYFSFGGNGAFSIDAPGVPAGRLLVTTSGAVGINNTNPAAYLDVGGNMRVSDVDQRGDTLSVSILGDINGQLEITAPGFDGPGPILTLNNPTGGRGAACQIQFQTYGNRLTSSIQAIDMGDYSNDLVFYCAVPGTQSTLASERMRITGAGNINVPGDIILTGADCAEQFDLATGAEVPEPGTVVVLGDGGGLSVSHGEYDRKVVGVVSGAGDYKHAILLDNRPGSSDHRVAVALAGKVCCKVDTRYGPVAVGDLLTTSPTSGHAMKATDAARAFGSVVGKALQALDGGQGLIPIVIALQ
jgi:hypothetical protein